MTALTRDELRTVLTDRTVYVRSLDASGIAPSAWLRSVTTLGIDDYPDRVAAIHPDDQRAYFDGFLRALHDPGATIEVPYRITAASGWTTERATFLVQFDNPDVRGVLIAVEPVGSEPAVVRPRELTTRTARADAPWAIFSIDATTATVSAQGDVVALLGRPADELVGGYLIDHVHPDDYEDLVALRLSLLRDPGGTRHIRARMVRADQREVWVEISLMNRLHGGGDGSIGSCGDVLIFVVDVSARKAREDALEVSNRQFRALAESVGVAVFRADARGRITFRNRRFDALVAGAAHAEQVQDLFWPDGRDATIRDLEAVMEDPSDEWELDFLTVDGQTTLRATWSASGEPRSAFRSYVGTIQDVTATLQLRVRAETDALTGLLNREAIEEHVRDALVDDPTGTLVLFVDLDGFKIVNDTYGHASGDIVLREVADRIRAAVRPTDAVGRIGGDEFVIVCRRPTPRGTAEASIVARISAALTATIRWDHTSWQPAASIGSARPLPGESAEQVLARADTAMFSSKRTRAGSR